MSAPSLLERAKSLLSSRAGLLGALVLAPISSVPVVAQVTNFTTTSSSFAVSTSGIPDYAGSYGNSIGSQATNAGAGVKLWGDSGDRTRGSLTFHTYDGSPLFYRDGLTLKWNGTFSGELIGNYYDAENNYLQGDYLAAAFDFTLNRTNVATSLNWELQFEFNGSRNTVRSGSVSGEETTFHVTGTTTSSNTITGNDTVTTFTDQAWSAYLVILPYASTLQYNYSDTDTFSVFVPTSSIDLSIARSAYYTTSAIPEPSTWALIIGSASLGLVIYQRRRRAT
ncbi:PEP-CTERM sorting domain-containing protein [Oleiharenicola lentus]|uniref:PEP-CTERM sorting domain-containing protein n=1 Tax=Oleiharenicola lentus TaxID=2508720 RepID=UPI003F676ABB